MRTVFYYIENGEIERIIQDEQDMTAYGEEKSKYVGIIDCIIIEDNEIPLRMSHLYKVINKKLVLK